MTPRHGWLTMVLLFTAACGGKIDESGVASTPDAGTTEPSPTPKPGPTEEPQGKEEQPTATCGPNNKICGRSQYCERPMGACGATGKCQLRPDACTDEYVPVCGCDDKTYESACEANTRGTSIHKLGACSSVRFQCGPAGNRVACDAKTEYCKIDNTIGVQPGHSCEPLPLSCQSTGGKIPACDCFPPPPPCASPACFQSCSSKNGPPPELTLTIGQ